MRKLTDQQIMQCLREGKRDKALRGLYQAYDPISRMIRSNGGREEDAKDIFHESLILFIEKVNTSSFVLTASISTYLYSVCRFMWYDQVRKQKHRSDISPEDLQLASTDAFEIREHLEKEAKLNALDDIINQLGEKCKTLLLLYYHKKFNMKRIAGELGYSSDRIAKNQKYKCLEKARKHAKSIRIDREGAEYGG